MNSSLIWGIQEQEDIKKDIKKSILLLYRQYQKKKNQNKKKLKKTTEENLHLSYFDDLEKRLGIKDLDFIEEGEFKV